MVSVGVLLMRRYLVTRTGRRTGVRSDPPVGGGIVKQLRRCRYLGEDIPFFRAADEGDLHADAADVNPERSHDLLKSPPQ